MVRNGINPGDSTPLVLAGWNPPLSWKAENFSTQGCQTVDDRRRVRSLVYQNMDVGTMTTQIFEMELDAAGSSLLRRLRHLTGWCLPSPVPVHRAGTGADLHVAGARPIFRVDFLTGWAQATRSGILSTLAGDEARSCLLGQIRQFYTVMRIQCVQI